MNNEPQNYALIAFSEEAAVYNGVSDLMLPVLIMKHTNIKTEFAILRRNSKNMPSDIQQYTAATLSDLDKIAGLIIKKFPDERVFALSGAMGAGKTTLIKSLCHVLGVADVVNSPTFALINEYRTAGGNPVYHFDFYRIKSHNEAFDMGYEEYFYSGNFCFIEWPEKIRQLLPERCVYISIAADDITRYRKLAAGMDSGLQEQHD